MKASFKSKGSHLCALGGFFAERGQVLRGVLRRSLEEPTEAFSLAQMVVGQNQWLHFGVGAPPILVYFSGDWDVHWRYGILTDGQMALCNAPSNPLVGVCKTSAKSFRRIIVGFGHPSGALFDCKRCAVPASAQPSAKLET